MNDPTIEPLTVWDEFRVALHRAGMSQTAFAKQQGVSWHHLYYVVKLGRPSEKLMGAVRGFIEEHEAGG